MSAKHMPWMMNPNLSAEDLMQLIIRNAKEIRSLDEEHGNDLAMRYISVCAPLLLW